MYSAVILLAQACQSLSFSDINASDDCNSLEEKEACESKGSPDQ